jgi:hypothetical protein
VIDRNGRIAYKPGGPTSQSNLETVLKPQFESAGDAIKDTIRVELLSRCKQCNLDAADALG